MQEHIPNKTEDLLSLDWESLGDTIVVYSDVSSETIQTAVPLNKATTLEIISYRVGTRYGLSYGIVKVNAKSQFQCAITKTINYQNENIPLTEVEFENAYLKSIYSEIDGVVLFYDNFREIITLPPKTTYKNTDITPPFYLCLRNQVTTLEPKDIKITLGYMATYLPTTGKPTTAAAFLDNIDTEEEYIEIE